MSNHRMRLVCRRCGDVVPRHYMTGVLCYSCHLDRYVPLGYERKEKYRRNPIFGHANATCRPPMGVMFLDMALCRVRQIALLPPRTSCPEPLLRWNLDGREESGISGTGGDWPRRI